MALDTGFTICRLYDLGQIINLFLSQFFHLLNGLIIPTSHRCSRDEMTESCKALSMRSGNVRYDNIYKAMTYKWFYFFTIWVLYSSYDSWFSKVNFWGIHIGILCTLKIINYHFMIHSYFCVFADYKYFKLTNCVLLIN